MPYKDKEKNKEYQKKYQKEWYKRNKKKHIATARKNKKHHIRKMAQMVSDHKSSEGCGRCPEADPVCLDLHHVNGDKTIDVSVAVQKGWGRERIKKEIDKCTVICANCHRKLHASLTQSG